MNSITKFIDYLNECDKKADANANEDWLKYGDTWEYKVIRREKYNTHKRFIYDGLKYEIIKVDGNIITCKRLGITLKKAPSGRWLKRFHKFSITSNMDKTLRFVK